MPASILDRLSASVPLHGVAPRNGLSGKLAVVSCVMARTHNPRLLSCPTGTVSVAGITTPAIARGRLVQTLPIPLRRGLIGPSGTATKAETTQTAGRRGRTTLAVPLGPRRFNGVRPVLLRLMAGLRPPAKTGPTTGEAKPRLAAVSAAFWASVSPYGAVIVSGECLLFSSLFAGLVTATCRVPSVSAVRSAPLSCPDTLHPLVRVGVCLQPMGVRDGRHTEKKGPARPATVKASVVAVRPLGTA